VVTWGAWLSLAVVLGLWALLWASADRWWLGTLAMYGPRWMLLPLFAPLAPAAWWLRRRALPVVLVSLVIVVFPVMRFKVPLFVPATTGEVEVQRIRVLTCNRNVGGVDTQELADLVRQTRPDVLAFQEWTSKDSAEEWQRDGWHVQVDGELCLASRYAIRRGESLGWDVLRGKGRAQRYELETPTGIVAFFNVHLASPRPGLEAVLAHRWRDIPGTVGANTELRKRESEIVSLRAADTGEPLIVAGDFNLPEDSAIYRRYWSQFADSHDSAGWGFGTTWHTRRFGALRIDHILTNDAWRCRKSEVGPDVGSDHRPVIAELERVGTTY
jgi:endonuclease/exonuclease/phosphatase (EEP) superfamily protein YafD